jgi:release factor glutamine methyltransferase
VRRDVVRRLTEAGFVNAALEGRWLVEQVAGPSADMSVPLAPEDADRLDALLTRRLAGEPLWRVIGEREFWGLPFRLSPDTLEPRPDSETLIEAALATLGPRRGQPLTMLDLGTGTGCLLIAMLHECPAASGLGIDLSSGACEIARANALANGVGERCEIRQGQWTEGLDARFDLILSNPPYIPSRDIAGLDREVREHDPLLALDGGADGLAPYRIFARSLGGHLAPGGFVVLEIGAGQEGDVTAIMREAGWCHRATRRDLGDHPRALIFALH